jgi:hypothetical protein
MRVYLTAKVERLCACEAKGVLQGGEGVVVDGATDAKHEGDETGYACVFEESQKGAVLCCRSGGLALGRGVTAKLDLYDKDTAHASRLTWWRVEDEEDVWDGGRMAPWWNEFGGYTVWDVEKVGSIPDVQGDDFATTRASGELVCNHATSGIVSFSDDVGEFDTPGNAVVCIVCGMATDGACRGGRMSIAVRKKSCVEGFRPVLQGVFACTVRATAGVHEHITRGGVREW